jgi:hypothetical protein
MSYVRLLYGRGVSTVQSDSGGKPSNYNRGVVQFYNLIREKLPARVYNDVSHKEDPLNKNATSEMRLATDIRKIYRKWYLRSPTLLSTPASIYTIN